MKAIYLLPLLALGGCAYNQAPIVDLNGKDQAQYEQDYAYCQEYALKVDKGEAAKVGAANSAAVGAGGGAVVGAIENGLEGALIGAAVGAAAGGAYGAAEGSVRATETQALVLRNCLKEKGYKVYDVAN
ncbi:glycine zipper family protein [Ferrimonas sp. YFM]|uniref:glycine zipper family protein n=1 Tax=Ferrimonas sp. YFM TaxID=3028878 RepID=UPI002572E914|nr:glycine zipper family protein [Ferrimonas sp. YFM]